jgi:predicted Zn finger-like uncharacterized protein
MQIHCPACNTGYEVEQSVLGQLVQCNCGHEFTATDASSAPSQKTAASPKTKSRKKTPRPDFGKPGGLLITLLDAGWGPSDFNRYGDAGYKLLCWFIVLYQKVVRLAFGCMVIASGYMLYKFFGVMFSMKLSMKVIWEITKTAGVGMFISLGSMWLIFFAQLVIVGVLFQVVKSVASIEINTRSDE